MKCCIFQTAASYNLCYEAITDQLNFLTSYIEVLHAEKAACLHLWGQTSVPICTCVLLLLYLSKTHLPVNPRPQGESPRYQRDQNTKHCWGEGDGGEHESPGEAAEVTGALSRCAHQDVHRGEQQAHEVERQREQSWENRKFHRCVTAQSLGHSQQ